ncbi:hypothetical protein FRC12_010276 [Ceratobasidium sp. 428]|nr:hypothetical protein FRC12_010276 [Ceratobasidium sp. 428]
MPRVPTATRQDQSHRPSKRVKLSHRRDRSSISLLGCISNRVGSTIAGLAGRLFSPVGPGNDQLGPEPLGLQLAIHTPPGQPHDVPPPSSISLLSVMADEHATFWEQLESTPDQFYLAQPCWIGIQTQTQGYDVRINPRSGREHQSFLDMDDSEEDSIHPTAGHSRLAPACPLGYLEDMFFTSLILADKVESDCSHSLRWWSRHCQGLWTISELRTMERRMLQSLDWDLSTSINCRSSYQSFLVGLTSFVPSI